MILWLATNLLRAYTTCPRYWDDITRYGLPVKIEADYWWVNDRPDPNIHWTTEAWNGKKRG